MKYGVGSAEAAVDCIRVDSCANGKVGESSQKNAYSDWRKTVHTPIEASCEAREQVPQPSASEAIAGWEVIDHGRPAEANLCTRVILVVFEQRVANLLEY